MIFISRLIPKVHVFLQCIQLYNFFQKLGFIIHPEKSVLEPSTKLSFLGFVLDSQHMTVRPKPKRIESALNEIQKFKGKHKKTIRDLAHIIGILVSLFPGVKYGPLHYRDMEKLKISLLKKYKGNFDTEIELAEGDYTELKWWLESLPLACMHILEPNPDIVLETDASLVGWGAFCPTLSTRSQGKWNTVEKTYHINVLELLAIYFALKTLCLKGDHTHIRILSDSSTAVAYIKAMGGTHSSQCNKIAKAIWEWSASNKVWLSCCYLPGKLNVHADMLSRTFKSNTEWMLNPEIFHAISSLWGNFDIDLFASRTNKQLAPFVSWRPDPDALFIDAFSFNWHKYIFYAFPPFSLIARVLQKIQRDQARGVIVVPLWPTQNWYTKLLHMTIAIPRYLPLGKEVLLLSEDRSKLHPLHHNLQLVACLVSGNASETLTFQKKLPESSWHPGGYPLKNSTALIKIGGLSSVQGNKLIHFIPL